MGNPFRLDTAPTEETALTHPTLRAWSFAALSAVATVAGMATWWSGRPERHLARAERCLALGESASLPGWLALPEATPRTRDRALLVRARAALARGRPAEAVGPLDAIGRDGPWATDAAFWKGRTLLEAGQSLRAAGWFRTVVERRPDDADAHRWLAAASYELGDHETAMAELREVARLDPDDPKSCRTLALLLKEDDDLEPSSAAYRATLRLDPAQPQARMEWAEVLATMGQYDEAERQLEICSGKVPEADRLELKARCLKARGEGEALRDLLGRAVARYPEHTGLLHQAAQLASIDGRTSETMALLDRVLALDPHHAASVYLRGLTRKALGDAEGAARDLARASRLKAAMAEMSKLNGEAARRPEDAEVRARIGHLCEELGKRDMAAFWYRSARAIEPGHVDARARLEALRGP